MAVKRSVESWASVPNSSAYFDYKERIDMYQYFSCLAQLNETEYKCNSSSGRKTNVNGISDELDHNL